MNRERNLISARSPMINHQKNRIESDLTKRETHKRSADYSDENQKLKMAVKNNTSERDGVLADTASAIWTERATRIGGEDRESSGDDKHNTRELIIVMFTFSS